MEKMEENSKLINLSHRQWVVLILSYFIAIKEFEEKIESLRQSLFQQNYFTPKSLFNYLDNTSKGFISLDDFIKFLQDNSINYDEKYLRQFIHNYDKDNDFSINYQEFKGVITPLTDDSYKEKEEIKNEEINNINEEKEEDVKKNNNDNNENNIENKDKNNEENDDENTDKNKDENKDKNKNNNENKNENQIEPDIIKIFVEILIEEMSLAEKTTEIAKQCIGSKFFTFYESFREIADDEKYITEENINNFFKRNGIKLNEKEAKGLIHRNDNDNDGKISFSEYKEIFYPVNNIQYKRSAKDYNKYLDEYNSIFKSGNSNKKNNSSYYPSRNNNLKTSYNNYDYNYNKYIYLPNHYKKKLYQSPKLKYTSSSLHYDYSTFADEDHDKYSRNKRNRNSSIVNLKNNSNNLYNDKNDCDLYYKRICCGCPLTTFIIHSPNCYSCLCYEL